MNGILVSDVVGMSMQQAALLAGLACVIVVIWGLRFRRKPPEVASRAYRKERDAAPPGQEQLPGDLAALLTELERLSAQVGKQIDDRQARLEQAMADADRRIASLRGLLAATATARPDETAPRGFQRQEARSAPAQPPAHSAAVPPAQSDRVDTAGDRHGAIYSLADEGLSSMEIAERLGRRIGEVELILNLRGAGRKAEPNSR